MAKRNALSNRELILVTRHLDNHRAVFEGLMPEVLIDRIRDDLDIMMTRRNLEGLSAIDGLEWIFPPKRKEYLPGEAYSIIASALIHLYYRLDETPPADLMNLAGESGPE